MSDLQVCAAHRGRRIVASDQFSDHRIDARVLSFLVRHNLVHKEAVRLSEFVSRLKGRNPIEAVRQLKKPFDPGQGAAVFRAKLSAYVGDLNIF